MKTREKHSLLKQERMSILSSVMEIRDHLYMQFKAVMGLITPLSAIIKDQLLDVTSMGLHGEVAVRLRVVLIFPQRERAKRKRAWKSPHARKASDFQARLRFARFTILGDPGQLVGTIESS